MRSDKTAYLVIEYLPFSYFDLVLHLFALVESVQQRLVDRLVHPVLGLFRPVGIEIAVLLGERDVVFDILPHVHYTRMIDGRAAYRFRCPSAL